MTSAPTAAPDLTRQPPASRGRRDIPGPQGRPALSLVAEGLTAVAAALLMTAAASTVELNPMMRIGQVSGLAALQLRLLLLLGCVLVACAFLMRRRPLATVRFAAAAVSGLASGVTAAGVSLALRDTTWPLNGQSGDAGNLQAWAAALMEGKPLDGGYPPVYPHLVAWTAEYLTDGQPGYALKLVGLLFVALLGPAAYLSWRLLLPPLWALGIGVTAALPMMQPYKPYTNIVLVAFVPVLAKLLQTVQRAPRLTRRKAAVTGGLLGLMLGLMFILYSGWFVWSAAGAVVLTAVLLVRLRRAAGTAALVTAGYTLGAATAGFLALAGISLFQLLSSAGATVDRYCYFDTYTEPTYFAMWRDDLPGADALSAWPLPGELGGVGLFTIVLLVGLAVALALGSDRASVLVPAACAASALLMRYWYASHMESDQAVMLYPRTSAQLLHCLLLLTGLACFLVARRGTDAGAVLGVVRLSRRPGPRAVAVGTLCALGLLFGMAGSATADKYMPKQDGGTGGLAWEAQVTADYRGHCSAYAPGGTCRQPADPATVGLPEPDLGVLTCLHLGPFPTTRKP
ncbi:hypothetical protein [Kitasatospora purpeofusca]|uniref:hypothetical protein n=1 Tax=Kitasatospora purpeofusca TaxID=67352 RepID=UPI002A5AC249|nr:hypothetical protein [Kitasatospora purpeofusca]MDY0814787.1 hypothetical protein [Kitasatospora purpeofusca]